jgi:hypothetical protein
VAESADPTDAADDDDVGCCCCCCCCECDAEEEEEVGTLWRRPACGLEVGPRMVGVPAA